MADATVRRKHEAADVDSRRIALIALVVVAILVVTALVVHAMIQHLNAEQPRDKQLQSANQPTLSQLRRAFADPLLEPAPVTDLNALRAEKEAMLSGYRWLDKERGVVQIPIERAMALLAGQPRPAPGAQ